MHARLGSTANVAWSDRNQAAISDGDAAWGEQILDVAETRPKR